MSEFADGLSQFAQGARRRRQGVRVPMREIALSGGEAPLRVYDTSGPQDVDVAKRPAEAARAVGGAAPGAPRRGGGPSPSCTTRARRDHRRRWSSSRCAKGCRPISCATKWRAAAPSSPPTSITSSSSR